MLYKKITLSCVIFSLLFTWNVSAEISNSTIPVTISVQNELTREESFIRLAQIYKNNIPDSYQYIELNFKDIPTGSELESALQILVYTGIIQNASAQIHGYKSMNAYVFYKIAEKITWTPLLWKNELLETKNRNTTLNDHSKLEKTIAWETSILDVYTSDSTKIQQKKKILLDVYTTLKKSHIDKDTIQWSELLDSAIEWIAKWSNDIHTVYFPPVESKNFIENLDGEYEWIGAYVDMRTPGVFEIISPISGSPAQKAGLKWWDIITHVWWKKVTSENSLEEVVSWVKWPAGTEIILTVQRWEDTPTFEITVTREKIFIKEVVHERLNSKTYYIEIRSFGQYVSSEFIEALEAVSKEKRVKRIIIDLRNNGWGYLEQVADMLSYMIPKWEPTAVVKYLKWEKIYTSSGKQIIDFNDYEIILLANSWTASASEIMIGTIQDYFPKAKLIWENTYGKGSVQTIRSYTDGSFLKYTVAKWFTGKTQTGIDGIWIAPDKEVTFDIESYKTDNVDNQLKEAREIKY